MRTNQPVTGREQTFGVDERLISTTNLKGVIESANETFIRISGFSHEELRGQPHNIVRHPDMPEAVYANFWETLKSGHPWMGVVKNRCKNGDHYWVSAYVSPVYRDGEQVGFQSVRTQPTEGQKQRAEALYERMRKGRSGASLWQRLGLGWILGVTGALALVLVTMGAYRVGSGDAASGAVLATAGVLLVVTGSVWASFRLRRLGRRARAIFDNSVGRVVYGNGMDLIAQAELAFVMQHSQLQALRGRVEDLTEELSGAASNSSKAADAGHEANSHQEQEIDEVAAAMVEMTGTVEEVSRNTSEASDLASGSADKARDGREVIVRTTEAMQSLVRDVGGACEAMAQLREEAQSIRTVLDVINGIAEQTNLLALNAAIEAARAGESGRGFAVVADEVRQLAHRVSDSTGEISTMIEKLESHTEATAKTMEQSRDSAQVVGEDAGRSSEMIQEIEGAVEKIRDMAAQIASATEEQSATANDISERISRIRNGAQETAGIAADTKGTSEALVEMVAEISGVVQQFKFQ